MKEMDMKWIGNMDIRLMDMQKWIFVLVLDIWICELDNTKNGCLNGLKWLFGWIQKLDNWFCKL